MDKFIRISSMQSGAFSETNNILTFNLPSDGVYDFASSYVELNTTMSAGTQEDTDIGGVLTAVYNPQLVWYNSDFAVNNAMFIRRGQLRTNANGVVEDVLRNDILRTTLVNYEKSTSEINALGYKSATQFSDHTDTFGSIWRNFNVFGSDGTGTNDTSTRRSAPINIPLDQVIQLGKSSMMPLDKMRGGQLTMELNANIAQGSNAEGWSSTVEIEMPLGISGTHVVIGGGAAGNAVDDLIGAGGKFAVGTDLPLELSKNYQDQRGLPFWIGANVAISGDVEAGLTFDNGVGDNCVVTSIYSQDNDGKVYVELDQSPLTTTTVSGISDVTLDLVDVKGGLAINEPIFTIDSANLVLKKLASPPATQDTMTYTTWETEEFSTAATTQLNQTFRLPAECINAFIMTPQNTGSGISHNPQILSYRISVDNIPVVNRDVQLATAANNGARDQLHTDLLMRTFENGGLPLKSLTELLRASDGIFTSGQYAGQTTTGRGSDLVMIPVPTQQTAQSKLLQLKLTAATAAIERVVVFKQVVRTIQM